MSARLLLSALGANLLLAGGNGERLRFAPEQGSSLSKIFTSEGEFALDEVSLIADGQDVGAMIGSFEVGMEMSTRIEVTDLYKVVAEGRPRELLRTFDGLESRVQMNVSQMDSIPEIESESELAGKSVLFRWDEERGDYDLSFQESEGEASLLEGLFEDMDLRFLLPEEEVEAGGSWTVELAALEGLATPGGNLRMMPADAPADPEATAMMEGLMDSFGEKFGDQLEGKCVCTFKGVRTEGEAKLAEIQLEIDMATTLDLREFLQQAVQAGVAQAGGEIEFDFDISTAEMTADFEGTGTLLWNSVAGRLHSFSLQGDMSFGMDIDMSIDAMGESTSMEASMEMSGEWRQEVTAGE